MKATLSFLQVKNFFFKKLKLEENPEGEVKNLLDIDFEFFRDDKEQLGIEFSLKYNVRARSPLIKADVVAVSLFEVNQKLPQEQREKLFVINGLVITYGMIRGILYQMCSVLPPSQRILPSINFQPLLREKFKDKE
ncbi:hypothetical protein [Desulfurobacterium sp.]